jgi:hypothetical protein
MLSRQDSNPVIALHLAVVRSCHFRLAPFSFLVENARSVPPQACLSSLIAV